MRSTAISILSMAVFLGGCRLGTIEVGGPFYLMYIKDPREVALFRCPDGPERGCAIDGLPGPRVVAAGADDRFVVVEQRSQTDAGAAPRYYYFLRVPQERSGWGNNPERIIGPLDQPAFAEAKLRLHLPDLKASFRP